MVRKVVVALAAMGLGTISAAPAFAQQATVGGRYAVQGTNPGGGSGTYSGFAEISGTAGGQCSIVWRIANTQSSQGFCMRQGDVFVAAYRLGNAIGLVIYRLGPDGTLDGTWSIAGQEGVGRERLTPVR